MTKLLAAKKKEKKKKEKPDQFSHKLMWKPESIGFHKNLRTTQHSFELWNSKNAQNTIGCPQNRGKQKSYSINWP
jgi:hypothetical protein